MADKVTNPLEIGCRPRDPSICPVASDAGEGERQAPMNTLVDTENRARIARITCGWKLPHLPLDWVRRYWRDVHSPSIARRAGIWDYRHFQFDAVDAGFARVDRIDFSCPLAEQLMWLSDVRYENDAALDRFGTSPDGRVKAQLLGDIDLIVDQSTTYKALGSSARTVKDATGVRTPQGVPGAPTYALFFRQRGDEPEFRAAMTALAERWASRAAVLRVRLSLFEVPDLEAERATGYPIKTHPVERQYQAWIDLVLADAAAAATLFEPGDATAIGTVHAYPVNMLCTFNYGGRPTFVGLRGFNAYEAIRALGGTNQAQPEIMEWMYGPAAHGVTLDA